MKNMYPLLTSFFSIVLFASPALADEKAMPSAPTQEPVILDLTPAGKDALEYDSNSHQGLTGNVAAPVSAPDETTLLERNGIDPDVSASASGLGAKQRIDLGTQQLSGDQISIKPYLELGADLEKREDTAIISGSGLAADTNAELGGGTTMSVSDQVDFRLGYTRKEPISGGSRDRDEEHAVESGVSIKF